MFKLIPILCLFIFSLSAQAQESKTIKELNQSLREGQNIYWSDKEKKESASEAKEKNYDQTKKQLGQISTAEKAELTAILSRGKQALSSQERDDLGSLNNKVDIYGYGSLSTKENQYINFLNQKVLNNLSPQDYNRLQQIKAKIGQ
ncbi:MAG: hypothetical protein Q7I89_08060 [Syntrophales bacterium]|nr:hypothetical protein [Syntrophales bacterium]